MNISTLAVALMSIVVDNACECLESTVQSGKDNAQVVFRGTVIALRPAAKRRVPGDTGKIAVFRVSRVWKGAVGEIFEMPADEATAACWGFSPELARGVELLVYVRQLWGSDYASQYCRTKRVKFASKDFEELGPGEEPKPATRLRQNSK